MENKATQGQNPYAASKPKKEKSPSWGHPAIYVVVIVLAIAMLRFSDPATERLGLSSLTMILVEWVLLVAFLLFGMIMHSVGKLAMGSLSGYKVIYFAAGPFNFVRENGRYVHKKLPAIYSLGQCMMAPELTDEPEKVRYFWYYFGGAFFEIFLAVLCVLTMILTGDPVIRWLASNALIAFVILEMVYLLPSKSSVPNDGATLMRLHKDPQARVIDYHFLVLAMKELDGVKPADMPEELFAGADVNGAFPYCQIALHRVAYYANCGEYEKARPMLEALMQNPAVQANSLLKMETRCELACCLMMLGQDMERVHELMDEPTVKFAQQMARTSLSGLRCLYMYALIAKRDFAEAEMLYVQASGLRESCFCLMEYETEMERMTKLRAEAMQQQ